jgi:hypothetical protein
VERLKYEANVTQPGSGEPARSLPRELLADQDDLAAVGLVESSQ